MPCEIVRATRGRGAIGADTVAAIRAIVARGAIPLVSLRGGRGR